ncbi:MAG TPA: discoidin domain-containing protein, partial [Chthoniobacteraceae bacterium]|nr:discoidin domain-containing protein [Chthoniobacteraceae bacterium]
MSLDADDSATPQPPIPVKFKLDTPGFVTLVIENSAGKRVRNLISETPFPAGDNIAWWDGTDDLGRDTDAARHGVYRIPAQFVAPGSYTVRGLVRGEIEPHYEFPIYASGHPAWETADKSGGWLTNHTPPQAALFVPAEKSPTGTAMVYLGSAVSEGGAGLAWVDLAGKKIGGRGWVGGNWTSAPYLARDEGVKADAETFAYVAAAWTATADNNDRTHGELRITGLMAKGDKPVLKHAFTAPVGADGDSHWIDQVGGIAVRDGLLVASMNKLGALIFVDAIAGEVLGTLAMESPRGLAFDAQGRLLALSGSRLFRLALPQDRAQLAKHLVPDPQSGVPLPAKSSSATASKQAQRAARALDADPATRWDTGGPMQKGDSFTLDLGAPSTFFKITMSVRASDDYPRGYEIFVSNDGQNWGQSLAQGKGERGRTRIVLPQPVTARFVKIVQTGNAGNYWSIDELTLDAPRPKDERAKPLPVPTEPLISTHLEDPHGLTLDVHGNIFVSDHGASQQVKVFTAEGKLARMIGKAGPPKAGPYDPLHMNHPAGLAVDANGRLWVAENDYLPKRVSIWNSDGTLWKAFYGPAKYGGGGTLDPQDKTRFYYADEGRGAIEFKLDWEKGDSTLTRVYYRREIGSLPLPQRAAAPELALYRGGRRYFANCYNSNPTGGSGLVLFLDGNGVARPVAALGAAKEWPLLRAPAFASRVPAGAEGKGKSPLFFWSDANDDGQVQPEEVTFAGGAIGGVTVLPDLSICVTRIGKTAMRFAPIGFSNGGTPLYDFPKGETLAEGVQPPGSSG